MASSNFQSGAILDALTAQKCQIVVNLEDLTNIVAYVMERQYKRIEEEQAKANETATLSVDEVAKLIGVAKTTLWQWEKKGILKPLRIGSLLKYKKSDVDEMLRFGRYGIKRRAGRPPKNKSKQTDLNDSTINA